MLKKSMLLLLMVFVVGLVVPVDSVPAQEDYWPTEGWRRSTPEAQGMDSAALADLLEDFVVDDAALDSLLVVRNGYLVMDAYVYPFVQGNRHEMFSVTKSITSTMIGVALQQGYIDSVDQTVVELLGELVPEGVDDVHAALTLEHMLMMGSGIDCPGDEGDRPVGTVLLRMEGDRYEDLLLEPMVGIPGARFQYCNPVSNLLSVIVTQTTSQTAAELGREFVFEPLGLRPPLWSSDSRGNSLGFAQLQMTPHDMAKIGYLYLNDGVWDGQQILPTEYVRAATTRQINAVSGLGYGYQWWVLNEDVAFAWGFGGQHIIINRALGLVIVTTATNNAVFMPNYNNLMQRVFNAVQSADPIAPNPDGVARLEAAEATLASPIAVEVDLLATIEGESLELPTNDLAWETLRISTTDDPDVLLLSVNDAMDVPIGMTSSGQMVSAGDAEWVTKDMMLIGEWSASDTLHITVMPFLPPGKFEVWLTFGDGEIVAMRTVG